MWTPIIVVFAATIFLWIMDAQRELEDLEHAHRLERMKS